MVSAALLTDALVSGIARVSNLKNSKVVISPLGNKEWFLTRILFAYLLNFCFQVVLCQAAEIDSSHYFDPTNGSVFLVDHLTLVLLNAQLCDQVLTLFNQVTSVNDLIESVIEDKNNELRKALQSSISSYVDSAYQSELSAGGVYAKDGKFNIVVTGEKNNLKNFWSGKWNSSWALSVVGQTAKISGDIKVC